MHTSINSTYTSVAGYLSKIRLISTFAFCIFKMKLAHNSYTTIHNLQIMDTIHEVDPGYPVCGCRPFQVGQKGKGEEGDQHG